MIPRLIIPQLLQNINKGKAIIILGPRQTGKTTLLHLLEKQITEDVLWLDCDEADIRKALHNTTSTQLKNLIGNYKMVFIDEAQRIKDIGVTLKLITDKLKNVQLVVTGSSSLELTGSLNEPLTGRKFEYIVCAPSVSELNMYSSKIEENRMLDHRLIYGMYPDVVLNPGNEKLILNNLAGSYLYKDLFTLQEIRKPETLEKLLEALALQLGNEVSFNELSKTIGIDQNTVQKYIHLLEQSFVVFRLRSFSRNLRTELRKSRKIYFYDNGIRNAILGSFKPFENRADKGALWENFLISERFKRNQIQQRFVKSYFWRTRLQQEIDYIEEEDDYLNAFEFKLSSKKTTKISKSFADVYPNQRFSVINKESYLDFIGLPD